MYPEPTGEVRMSLSLRFAAGSHKGMIREGNEDSGYAGPRLLAIADGMGGQAAGEVASSEVISTLVQLDDDVPGSDLLTSLGDAVQRANDQLRVMVEEDPQLEGMGTTLTALLWTGQRLGLVHVGDSRAYLLRDGVLTQITQDHTWVQRLVDEGRITEEEATTHPQRSLLMRALGSADHVEADLSVREVRAGDRYLLCSDGLSGVVSHQTMEEALASYQGPEETVQELIQLALRGGGPDNITVIVADVLDIDSGDTLAGQLVDTPVVVGAVAENPLPSHDSGAMQTPAGRAAGLGRQVPEQPSGAFGPPDSAAPDAYAPEGGFGPYSDEDYEGPPGGRKWLKRTLYALLALAVLGGGLYGAHRWTQTQYYVSANGDHIALYRGISQDLAWVSLSDVEEDHPDIELDYLPQYQQKLVKGGAIAEGGRKGAEAKIKELSLQASACKKHEANEKAERENNAGADEGEAGGSDGFGAGDDAKKDAEDEAKGDAAQAPSPTPAPSSAFTKDEQPLVANCGKQ
ncbi:Stp1/IreP family PP2C-type Ser/Thr phosphatase [Streptomyces sp. O3]